MTNSYDEATQALRNTLARAGWVIERAVSNADPLPDVIVAATRSLGFNVESPAEHELSSLLADAPSRNEEPSHQILWWIRAMRRAVDVKAPDTVLPGLIATLRYFAHSDPRFQLIYDAVAPIPAARYDQLRLTALTQAVNLTFGEDPPPAPIEAVKAALKSVRRFRLSGEPPPRSHRLESALFWLEAMRQSIPFAAQDDVSASLINALSEPKGDAHKLLYNAVLFTPGSRFDEPKIQALETAARLVFDEEATARFDVIADILRSAGLGRVTP